MDIRFTPFWTDDYSEEPPSGDLPVTADVAVIGGGITGLTAARRLARAGVATVVLEGMAIGDGASSINAGMAIFGIKPDVRSLMDHVGETTALALWQASVDAIDRIEQITAEEGIDCFFSRSGAGELGYTVRDVEVLTEEARWTTERLGFPVEVVPASRISDVVDSDRFSIALTDGVSAGLHPARYTFGLARAAVRAGAHLVEHAQVTGVDRDGTAFRLATTRGNLRAQRLLVTTNGYTGTLFPSIRRGIVPIGSYCIVTEPLPGDVAERLIPRGRMLWTARRFLNYFRRTPDDRILLGGRRNLRADLDLGASAQDLHRRLLTFFPSLEPYAITHSWGGKLGATFDLLPHIGRRDGVWYAMGYGGHGVALGTYLGTEVGAMIAGELASSPFADIPHPTRWYYRSRPWFLPFAAMGYRVLDRVGR
jgi:glycine/D-amino acid oxidase-like deaminating enzyme